MNFNFQEDIILENERVILKPLQENDFQNLLSIAIAHKNLIQYSPKQIFNEDLLQQYIAHAIKQRVMLLSYYFTIYDKQQNTFIGSTAFLNISNEDDRLEIGATFFKKELQGKGFNPQVKKLMLNYAFNKLNAHRVELRTDERNMQSRRAIEKIGGKLEGILREHMLMHDGFKRNTYCYSILRNEWILLKNNFNY